MKELKKYYVLRQEAEDYLAENAWLGIIFSGEEYYNKVETFAHSVDLDKCRAAAPKILTAEELFCDITENSNGSQFFLRHPDGSEVAHNSFKFKCTVKKVRFRFDGTKTEEETIFEGTYNTLELSREDTLHNVEIVK